MQADGNELHHTYVEFAPTWQVQLIKLAVSGTSERSILLKTRGMRERGGQGATSDVLAGEQGGDVFGRTRSRYRYASAKSFFL